ncbi:hypothetical protein ASF60_13005 [Methylobacterium sp. Leaf113]|nr:hypothetical protein ASF60_13005 [Methylobacterium sp. Leaf113]
MKDETEGPWLHALSVVRPALVLAPTTFLAGLRDGFARNGVSNAISRHDNGPIYDWVMSLVGLQGISDRVAFAFTAQHGLATWEGVREGLRTRPACSHLQGHWQFRGCGYQKSARTCAEPHLLPSCPLPALPLRKGTLNQAAYSLALFIRDACHGDLVGWIDRRLADADPGFGMTDRAAVMKDAVLSPLSEVHGVGPKVWSMLLADLLLGADPSRERWVATGAAMIAIDSLVHAFLHRTGILRRLECEHPYGPACYGPAGCASVIGGLARRIDAREFNAAHPVNFSRFVQAAIWAFCAEGGYGICNGNKIDDRQRCDQIYCPAYSTCDRIVFRVK